MAVYKVQAPDGSIMQIEGPDGATDSQIAQAAAAGYQPKAAPKPEKSINQSFLEGARDVAAGAVRGAGSIAATGMRLLPNALGGDNAQENAERRARLDENARNLMGADTESLAYSGGKLAGEIAGTAGVGGGLAGLLSKIPGLATKAAPVIEAIRSSGMTAGGLTGKAGIAARVAGGGVTGLAAATAVNPELNDMAMGAGIGAVAPPIVMVGAKVGGAVGNAVRSAMMPQDVKLAQKLAVTADMPVDQLRSLLQKQGPQLIESYQATVPQLLQNPAISQLQRTLKTAGNDALGSAERTQQQQFMQTLNRVAPTNITVQDAAARAGGAIEDFANPARKEAGKAVSRAFDAVDPFNETRLYLPAQEMQAGVDKYLGSGTFGVGGQARAAMKAVNEVGTDVLPAIKAIPQSAGRTQSLEQAVRGAGGIRPGDYLSREISELGSKQSKTTGLIGKAGKDVESMANDMYARGFLPDNDPATMLNMLRNGGGRGVYAADHVEAGFQRMAEQSMGDLPGKTTIAKPVDFQTIQNLRSSIGEAAQQASLAGSNKEAAALKAMVSAIDDKITTASNGGAQLDEFFAADMANNYKQARALHADKIARFETGPQIGMFRKGSDGQTVKQGAEIPGQFYSGKRSQVEDMQAFKRLIGNDAQAPQLLRDLQSYATTEGANTATAAGNLTSKYGDWLASRSGANRGLFDPGQNAALKAVDDAIQTGASAENLGRVTGSDTAQKLASLQSLGILDSKLVNVLANRIPIVGNFTGPMVDGLRNTARGKQSDSLAQLLADPQQLDSALGKIRQAKPTGELAQALLRGGVRSAPVAISSD